MLSKVMFSSLKRFIFQILNIGLASVFFALGIETVSSDFFIGDIVNSPFKRPKN